MRLELFSEPYSATGGLAAEGVLNQLGRPDIEPLEVLVREAVQNCWDARRAGVGSIRVEIGRRHLDGIELDACRDRMLVDPPPGLPLADELVEGMQILYFADFGTDGLAGPTRADRPGDKRDFVDFVRNIGQPPDKDLGGGSFGYGKAAFYIASRARTVLIDTLCVLPEGGQERRFMGCGLGENFEIDGRPYTGRHWWGRVVDGVPEPLTGEEAAAAAGMLGLPPREGPAGLGTTIAIVAPGVAPESEDGTDSSIAFIADTLVWNFWPRMIDTSGGARRTMEFRLADDGRAFRIPDPRTHPRLRGFVEAMDRLREDPRGDGDLIMDRSVECLRPAQTLGRLVIQKGPVAPVPSEGRTVPQGARLIGDSVHHVALMRNAELVVNYLPGPAPTTGRLGYSGVFRCAVDVDDAFRMSEPPTHDDWVFNFMPKGRERTFVKVALERIRTHCREAAGFDASIVPAGTGDSIPLGEFADALATLLPGAEGPGARRPSTRTRTGPRRRRKAPGRTLGATLSEDVWVDGRAGGGGPPGGPRGENTASLAAQPLAGESPAEGSMRRIRLPQARSSGDPWPALSPDGQAVIRYPFELRGHGNRVRFRGTVEVMTGDGGQVESDAPVGYETPSVTGWISPAEVRHEGAEIVLGPDGIDGGWVAEVPLVDEAMLRVDVTPEIA